jgi:predicted CopG family antitoxin
MKVVTLDEEAYRLLNQAKVPPEESFSSVMKRLLGAPRAIEETAGSWSGMSDEDIARLRDETCDAFGTTKK